MTRVGILGAGFIARAHAAAYASLPGIELAVVADPRAGAAEALARAYGARAATSAEAVWESDVEVVSVCTPTPTHVDLSLAGLRAGKHVLCEKPIAGDVVEAEALVAGAREAEARGVRFMVGHVSRFEADHLRAKELLDRGDIGPLAMAHQSITGSFPEWSSEGWFADAAKSGGPLVDLAIHSFDYLSWLFAEPVERVSVAGVRSKLAFPTYALTTLRFVSGRIATVEVSWAHTRSDGFNVRTELTGTRGRIAWTYRDIAAMRVSRGDSPVQEIIMPGENSFAAEIKAFIDAIRADKPVPVPAEEALAALRIAAAANESLARGTPVSLAPVTATRAAHARQAIVHPTDEAVGR